MSAEVHEAVSVWQEVKDLRREMRDDIKDLNDKVNELVAAHRAYRAVMRFAVAVGGATGAFVAFIAEFFLRK